MLQRLPPVEGCDATAVDFFTAAGNQIFVFTGKVSAGHPATIYKQDSTIYIV